MFFLNLDIFVPDHGEFPISFVYGPCRTSLWVLHVEICLTYDIFPDACLCVLFVLYYLIFMRNTVRSLISQKMELFIMSGKYILARFIRLKQGAT